MELSLWSSSSTRSRRRLAAALLALAVMVAAADALPRTRTIKSNRLGSLSNSLFGSSSSSSSAQSPARPSCERNVPCGWALYHQTWRSALRPIFQYTRNTLCECDLGTSCVYQENRSEMRAYVFYCRRNDGSKDLYEFPNNT